MLEFSDSEKQKEYEEKRRKRNIILNVIVGIIAIVIAVKLLFGFWFFIRHAQLETAFLFYVSEF